jgi:hypothetical protein
MDKKLVNSKATQAPNQEKYIRNNPLFSFHEAQASIIYRMYGVEESLELINAYGTRTLRKELSIEYVGLYYGRFKSQQDNQNI